MTCPSDRENTQLLLLSDVALLLLTSAACGASASAMVNLCRDEICNPLKRKLVAMFGDTFNTLGLGGGGVLTAGITGMAAGLSHAPLVSSQ